MLCNPVSSITNYFFKPKPKAQSIQFLKGIHVDLVLPNNPLNKGAFRVESHSSVWNKDHHLEAFQLIQKTIRYWKYRNMIGDYMVFGKVSPDQKFTWEVVPFPKTSW